MIVKEKLEKELDGKNTPLYPSAYDKTATLIQLFGR